jgi:hypothetical protein
MRLDLLASRIAFAEGPKAAALRREWELALSIVEPISTERAYARFGFCLGLFPPFAIFARILLGPGAGMNSEAVAMWAALLLGMNVVCCISGWLFAAYIGRKVRDPRTRPWNEHVGYSIAWALAWACVAGGLGGFVGFGIGSVFGAVCAMPVALATFPVFASLHRVQSHGGMIEERDLRPLAYGIPLAAAAMILMLK